MHQRIAVISADRAIVDLLTEMLTEEGFVPYPCSEERAAVRGLRAISPDALVLDIPWDWPAAVVNLLQVLALDPDLAPIPRTRCAGGPGLAQWGERLQRCGFHVVAKPFDLHELLAPLVQVMGRAVNALAVP